MRTPTPHATLACVLAGAVAAAAAACSADLRGGQPDAGEPVPSLDAFAPPPPSDATPPYARDPRPDVGTPDAGAADSKPAPANPPFDGFYLPLVCNTRATVSQGNFGAYSHRGNSAYAFDFSLGVGTRMVAMAKGKVVHVYAKTKPGDPCYSGGGPSCITKANLVWIRHPDGSRTIYGHLSSVKVKLGQKVARGQVIGRSGASGYATGPHAHVGRMRACCKTIPLRFADVGGNGVPGTGQRVRSKNCLP